MKFKILLFISFLVHSSLSVYSDDPSNARGIGMSKATMLSSVGIDAFGINPANFDYELFPAENKTRIKHPQFKRFPKPTNWNLSVLSVGGNYGCDSTLEFFDNYLSYLTVNRDRFADLFTDINSILSFRDTVLPNKSTQVNYDFELKWFSFNVSDASLGALNITVTDKVGLNTNAYSRDDAMPLTFRFLPGENGRFALTNLEINQSEATAWWIRKYTVGIAKHFKTKGLFTGLSVGISGGLVHGFGNIITHNSSISGSTYGVTASYTGNGKTHIDSITGHQDFRTQAALTDFFRDYIDGATAQFTFFPKPAGKGYVIDLGFNAQLGDKLNIGASMTDLGSINWDHNTYINFDTEPFEYHNFDIDPADPTYNRFVNDLEGLDTRDTTSSYETKMPTKYRVGVLYKHSDKLLVEANFIQGQNNNPGNSDDATIAIGSEYYITNFLPVRAGFSFGGPGTWYAALGTGLRFRNFILDIGTNGINHLFSNSRVSFALSGKIIL